jgi:hypothetical protein
MHVLLTHPPTEFETSSARRVAAGGAVLWLVLLPIVQPDWATAFLSLAVLT